MAKLKTMNGTQLLIKVGDGATPETFAHPVLINLDRSFELKSSGNKIEVPDPDNPNDPAWTEFVKQTIEGAISGAGILNGDAETMEYFTNWVGSVTSKNIQVWLGTIGYWAGAYQLTEFKLAGKRGDKISADLSFESDGAVVWNTATTTTA